MTKKELMDEYNKDKEKRLNESFEKLVSEYGIYLASFVLVFVIIGSFAMKIIAKLFYLLSILCILYVIFYALQQLGVL